MRSKDPELMERIRAYAGQFYRDRRACPSVGEIARALGIAKTTAYRYLLEMNERGMLVYDGRSIETAQTDKCTTGYCSAPIVGSIRCGDPEQEEQTVEEYVSLPESVFGKGPFYLLRADGDSMTDVGIDDGDLVLIRRQSTASVGDVVVALDEHNQNTLKTFAGIDGESGCAVLRYENRERYPDKIIRMRELVVQGVAARIIKNVKA